jgi:hypothetical protein
LLHFIGRSYAMIYQIIQPHPALKPFIKSQYSITKAHSCRDGLSMLLGQLWLNRVDRAIEFSALANQCLDRRSGDIVTLENEVLAWVNERNQQGVKINWLFDRPQARKELKRHYVKLNSENSRIIGSTD